MLFGKAETQLRMAHRDCAKGRSKSRKEYSIMAKQMTLEEMIRRVEEISAKLAGEISIDDSIALYTEAVKLIGQASSKLDAAKLKVEKLTVETEAEK